MLIRPHLADLAFSGPAFARLTEQYRSGALGPERCRLASAPKPLGTADPRVWELSTSQESQRDPMAQTLREQGIAALQRGEIAVLVLCGGMATRFGGGAKACHPLWPRGPSFVQAKIAQITALSRRLGLSVPVVIMDSFATREQIRTHLQDCDWMGLATQSRHLFSQSLLPRLDEATAAPLAQDPKADAWPDTALYCAPGHGDTLPRLRDSGCLASLLAGGQRHLLISNVDNLYASLDPTLVGAHLAGVAKGAQVSVEAVARRPGEAGGCVVQLRQGPAIVESFRLPQSANLDDYPDFNTNTLWIDVQALSPLPELVWHPVRRTIELGDDTEAPRPCVQFEQLIGELTEHRPTQVLRVAREQRFLPIKRQEDLRRAESDLRAWFEHACKDEAP